MKIGAMELIVIFIVALFVIGPDKLPSYARRFGNALREFRKASSDVTQDIRQSVVEPLEEAQRPLREAMEPLEELNKEVKEDFKGVEQDLRNIGKSKILKKEDSTELKTDYNEAGTAASADSPDVPGENQPTETECAAAAEKDFSDPAAPDDQIGGTV